MLLNAIALELATIIKEQVKGWTVYPLTINTDDYDNPSTVYSERFIHYHKIGNTSPSHYFINNAQTTPEAFILIKYTGHHLRVVSIQIQESKIRIKYWRAYGWGAYHTKLTYCNRSLRSPLSSTAKLANKHILLLKHIWKAHRSKKRWHPIHDKIDLNINNYDHMGQTIIDTINQSYNQCSLYRVKSEFDIDILGLGDNGTIMELDSWINYGNWWR